MDAKDIALMKKLGGGGSGLPTGGAPYQYLVTDGDGGVKWEDRLAYEGSRVVIDTGGGSRLVKVADEVPSWASVDSPVKVWLSDGNNITKSPEEYIDLGNGSFAAGNFITFITTDNLEFKDYVFPEKGVYFLSVSVSQYITGAASADSDTPEITWDGNIGEIKKIDEKFIPDDRFVVTFRMAKTNAVTSDKTFAEISTAIESGLYVYGLLIAGVATFDNIPATQVYALQMSQYVLGRGVAFIGLSASPSALTVSSLYVDADNNISTNELSLISGE